MKKISLILLIAILTANIALGQSDWINYKIDSKLSVKLPAQPKPVKGGFFAMDKDSLVYFFLKADVGIDSVELMSLAPTAEFAEHYKMGVSQKMPGTRLGDVNIGKWNGYVCYNIAGVNDTNKKKIYIFVIVVGDKMYSFGTIIPGNKSEKGKDEFFNSLFIN